jgi:hypothetical protein
MPDIAERTRTIIAEQLVVDPDEVVDGASFMEDLGAETAWTWSSWHSNLNGSSVLKFPTMPQNPF